MGGGGDGATPVELSAGGAGERGNGSIWLDSRWWLRWCYHSQSWALGDKEVRVTGKHKKEEDKERWTHVRMRVFIL